MSFSVTPAGKQDHYRVEANEVTGKSVLMIGNTPCVVKKGNTVIDNADQLQEIVELFNKNLKSDAEIGKKQKWVVNTEGSVEVHQKKFLSKKFKCNDRATKKILQESDTPYQKTEDKTRRTSTSFFQSRSEPSTSEPHDRTSTHTSKRSSTPPIILSDMYEIVVEPESLPASRGAPSEKRKSIGSELIDTESSTGVTTPRSKWQAELPEILDSDTVVTVEQFNAEPLVASLNPKLAGFVDRYESLKEKAQIIKDSMIANALRNADEHIQKAPAEFKERVYEQAIKTLEREIGAAELRAAKEELSQLLKQTNRAADELDVDRRTKILDARDEAKRLEKEYAQAKTPAESAELLSKIQVCIKALKDAI